MPDLFTVNPVGDSFKPRALDDETLLATTYATQVMISTANSFQPARSPLDVKRNVAITNDKKTDFFLPNSTLR